MSGQSLTLCRQFYLNGEFHRYANGYYKITPKEVIGKEIVPLLGDGARKWQVTEVRSMLAEHVFIKPDQANPVGFLPLQNGLMELNTGELTELTPEKIFTYKLKHASNENAECRLWQQTLDEILPDKAIQRLIQQFFGYIINPTLKFQKCLLLHGEEATEKALFWTWLRALVGPENTSTLQLTDLSARFRPAELCGKLLNLAAET